MRKVFNSKGFTMIEVLIIAALLGVMITTFASYQYQRARQNRVRETHTSFAQLQNNLKNSIAQSESLTQAEDQQYASLGAPVAPPVPGPTAADATPIPPCPTGCTIAADGVCDQSNQNCYQDNSCIVGCRLNALPTNGGSFSGGGGNGGNVGGNNGGVVNGGNGNGGNGGGIVNGGGNGGGVTGVQPTVTPSQTCAPPKIWQAGANGGGHCCCPQGSPPSCGTLCVTEPGGTTAGGCKTGIPPDGTCSNGLHQCAMNQASHYCTSTGKTVYGKQYCSCPNTYIYANPVCPASTGGQATQCYLQ